MSEYLAEQLTKWPDYLEVYKDENERITRVQVVVERRNSRNINWEQLRVLHTLEELGIAVKIKVMNVYMTLEDFDKSGVYSVKGTTRSPGPPMANARSELRKLEATLAGMVQEDPNYMLYVKRVSHLRAMFSVASPEATPQEERATIESGKALERLKTVLEGKQIGLTADELYKKWFDDPFAVQAKEIIAKLPSLQRKVIMAKRVMILSQESFDADPTNLVQRQNLERFTKDYEEVLQQLTQQGDNNATRQPNPPNQDQPQNTDVGGSSEVHPPDEADGNTQ